jgi:hypothetical protein
MLLKRFLSVPVVNQMGLQLVASYMLGLDINIGLNLWPQLRMKQNKSLKRIYDQVIRPINEYPVLALDLSG